MKYIVVIFMGLFFSVLAMANEEKHAVTGVDIPQLLGVWYGEYTTDVDSEQKPAEIWMEIAFQKSIDGYILRGYNRWNVLEDTEEQAHGAKSLGKNAEHFDTFHGELAKSGDELSLIENHSQSTIHGILAGENSMTVEFTTKNSQNKKFNTTLNRIDMNYSPDDINILGIDVSHHSGKVDWQKVKSQGYKFAYIKASEGMDNPDAMFATHWNALRKLNMPRGAYHFFVTEDDPLKQAELFLSRLKQDPGTLPPVVDVEYLGKNTKGDMSATLLVFLQTVEKELGVKPMIYTTPQFWDKHYRPEFSDYYLWMSEFGVKMPKVPFGWKNWTFWQFQADKAVEGVEKTADLSMIHPAISLHEFAVSPAKRMAK